MPPFNGSGTFNVFTPGNPVVTDTVVSSSVHNSTTSDIAAGLSQAMTRSGQSPATGNIPLGNNKITGLASGTVATDAANIANLQNQTGMYVATVAGTATAITLAPSPAITAYVVGQLFAFIAASNCAGATTVAVSGLAAKAITKAGAVALSVDDFSSSQLLTIQYDGTRFQLISALAYSNSAGADGVGFIQADAGAVAQTVQDALRNQAFINQYTGGPAIATAGKKIRLGKDVYNFSAFTVDGIVEIIGDSPEGSIIEFPSGSDGFNLTDIDSSLRLEGVTLRFPAGGSPGKLVKVSYNNDLVASYFYNTRFLRAATHIDTENGRTAGESTVAWTFRDCFFSEQTVRSHRHGASWAMTIDKCYFKGGVKGIEFVHNIASLDISGTTIFELIQGHAIDIFLNTGATLEGAHISAHFEANLLQSVAIDGAIATAAINGLDFDDSNEFSPTVTPTVYFPNPGNVTNIQSLRIGEGRGMSISDLFNNSNASSVRYLNNFQFQVNSAIKRQLGQLAGNSFTQIASIPLALSEAHRVQCYAAQNGLGTILSYQEYIVWRDVSGTVNQITVHDTATGGHGCVITAGASTYSIDNKPAMAQTYQPYIIVNKV